MAETITLTIDGQECQGTKGMTILEVAKANGIEIPTLCHHPWLSTHGGCRMCVVEVEGQRRLVTACAAPAGDGQVVVAHNEKLETLRQMTLELLFAERNHICPFCPMTGVCELQDKAYEHGITHTRYDYIFPVLTPDTSAEYFVRDHNRCILCGRCVRACNEISGVGTLGFGYRGTQELIIADLGVPLGDSTCISCGSCVDSCPTGALFDKRAPYFSRAKGLERRAAICPDDDLGCVMNVVLKSGMVARIEGTDAATAPVNGPLLSWRARYQLLNEPYPRVMQPKLRNESGELVDVDWDTALNAAAAKLVPDPTKFEHNGIVGIASCRMPLETLQAFHTFLTDQCKSIDLDTTRGSQRQTRRAAFDIYGPHTECDFQTIKDADFVLLVGIDPVATHPVLGAWLAKKRHQDGCPIVLVSPRTSKSSDLSLLTIKPRRGCEQQVLYGMLGQMLEVGGLGRLVDRDTAEKWRSHPPGRVAFEAGIDAEALVRAAQLYAGAKRPVILYGPDLLEQGNPTLIGRLWDMAQLCGHVDVSGAVAVRGFYSGANCAGAEEVGYRGADLAEAQTVYLLEGDDPINPTPQMRQDLREADFVILQASHESPLVEFADVVLPSLKWSERGGTWVNVTGLRQTFEPCTLPPAGVQSDEWVIEALAARLGATVEEATHE